jgi:hypothetical protein
MWLLLGLGLLTLGICFPLGMMEKPGEQVIRHTIWIALLFYLVAGLIFLQGPVYPARPWWTLACLAYLAHVAAAFHFFHGWSHTHAFEHTRQASGFGPGIFVTYAFTLLWMMDVGAWWSWPDRYARRLRWLQGLIHGFMAFMIFNGTVVFARGFSRWAGVALFVCLALALWFRFRATPAARLK